MNPRAWNVILLSCNGKWITITTEIHIGGRVLNWLLRWLSVVTGHYRLPPCTARPLCFLSALATRSTILSHWSLVGCRLLALLAAAQSRKKPKTAEACRERQGHEGWEGPAWVRTRNGWKRLLPYFVSSAMGVSWSCSWSTSTDLLLLSTASSCIGTQWRLVRGAHYFVSQA